MTTFEAQTMNTNGHGPNEQERLTRILRDNDEEGFRDLVQEHMDVLLRVAQQEIEYYVFEAYLNPQDLAAEDVVGEALIHGWEQLRQRPEGMSLRGWLLGVEYRTVQKLVEQLRRYRDEKAISLDDPLPMEPDNMDVQEWFWEWYQPDATITWEDVVPAVEPVDMEIPLYDVRDTLTLDPDARHVLMMHDEFEVPIQEVAFAMNRAVVETAELIDQARASLRERLAVPEPAEAISHPAPPDGSDR
jgi:RNA polymerase sigma-70 factor (ECF subfamily)